MSVNNKAIHFLRGELEAIKINDDNDIKLEEGQPLYNLTDNYLTVGNKETGSSLLNAPISSTAIKGMFDGEIKNDTSHGNYDFFVGAGGADNKSLLIKSGNISIQPGGHAENHLIITTNTTNIQRDPGKDAYTKLDYYGLKIKDHNIEKNGQIPTNRGIQIGNDITLNSFGLVVGGGINYLAILEDLREREEIDEEEYNCALNDLGIDPDSTDAESEAATTVQLYNDLASNNSKISIAHGDILLDYRGIKVGTNTFYKAIKNTDENGNETITKEGGLFIGYDSTSNFSAKIGTTDYPFNIWPKVYDTNKNKKYVWSFSESNNIENGMIANLTPNGDITTIGNVNAFKNIITKKKDTQDSEVALKIVTGKNSQDEDIETLKIFYSGNVSTPGSVTANQFKATSDRRLKENIIPYKYKKSILDLPIYEFDYKNSDIHTIGCMAQDLKEICPEIVSEDSDGFLHIEESKLVYLLLQEVKKLKYAMEASNT